MSRWRSTVFFAAPVLPAFFVAIETSPLQGSPRRYRRRRGRTVEAACCRRRTTIRATPPQGALRGAAHQPALRDALLVALAVFFFVPFAELLPAVFFAGFFTTLPTTFFAALPVSLPPFFAGVRRLLLMLSCSSAMKSTT